MPAYGSRTPRRALALLAAAALVGGLPAAAQPPAPPATVPLPVPAEMPAAGRPAPSAYPYPPAGTASLGDPAYPQVTPPLPTVPTVDPNGLPHPGPPVDFTGVPHPVVPLPGSLADEYAHELRDREAFRTTTWGGSTITSLPNTLLWEPALAVRRDPRLQFTALSKTNYEGGNLDTAIGGTAGLIRADVYGADLRYQLDMFGVVQTRLGSNDLQAADYRFGVPVTWQRGWWQGKVGYEHTSAHLGDKFLIRTGRGVAFYAKDELVLGLGRIIDCQWRVYAHLAYAFNNQLPDFDGPVVGGRYPNLENSRQNATRGDIGFEWFDRKATGFAGTPFVAANVEVRGDQSWSPNFRAQAGWLFRNPTQRMGNMRVFAEYYTGHTPYGQFYLDHESNFSAGFGFDY